MRILLWGDLAATGFGTVTLDLGKAMLERGEDLRFISLNEDAPAPEPFTGRVITLGDPSGWLNLDREAREREAIGFIARVRSIFTEGRDGWVPEATIIVGDPASIIRSGIQSFLPDGFPAFHYVPIEGVGIPPRWGQMWTNLRPVAMCKFGAEQVATVTGEEPPYVYHGVDTASFYPVSRLTPIWIPRADDLPMRLNTKAECKRLFGAEPDRFVLFRADRNMPRKRYGSLLRAVAPFLHAHPKAELWMHCRTIDEGGNLDDFRSHFPRHIANRMRMTGYQDMGVPVERPILNAMYNAADLYVSTSSEGFGLTIAEALAAGLPAVGMDFSSVPEVIGNAGVTVPISGLVENIYAYGWGAIDEAKLTEAIEALYRDDARRGYLSALGPLHVKRSFTWAGAAERFGELIRAALPMEAVA